MAKKVIMHQTMTDGSKTIILPQTITDLVMCQLEDDSYVTLTAYLEMITDEIQYYGQVTPDQNGLMTSEDKIKLDGIAIGATNYVEPTQWPAAMIVEDDNRHFVSLAMLAQLNAMLTSGVSAEAFQALVDQLNDIIFELTLQGILDGGSYGDLTVDTIDSATAVQINAGQYASGKAFI
jgi:hypothetical protein